MRPPRQEPVHDGHVLAQLLGPLDTRLGHGFVRGNQGKLREAIEQVQFLAGECGLRIVAVDLGGVAETELRGIDSLDRANCRPPTLKSAPELYLVIS